MKLKLNFGAPIPEGREVGEERMKEIIQQNRWQRGVILLNGHSLEGERKRSLGGYAYRIGNQELKSVDGFNPTEYQEWRDG